MRNDRQISHERLAYRKYYVEGEEFQKLNMELIKTISTYASSHLTPDNISECIDIIHQISNTSKPEDILRRILMYQYTNQELSKFLIKAVTEVFH